MAQTAAVTVLTLAALVMLAMVAAHWTWQWLAPAAEPAAELAADSGSASGSTSGSSSANPAGGLFGREDRDHGSSLLPTGLAISLLGVVAATAGRPAYAVVQFEPRQIRAVRVGQQISPGISLAEVANDHVILERAGVRETLSWPRKTKTADIAPPRIVN
jgi:general secretion pathway protein C